LSVSLQGVGMTEADASVEAATEAGPPIDRRAALWIFAASVVATLATTFSPPLLRMFSTEIWRALGWTEVGWSVFLAARGLFLIVFILMAGAAGDLLGRRRVLLLALAGYLLASLVAATAARQGAFLVMEGLLPILDAFVKTLALTLLILAFQGRERLNALIAYSGIYLLAFVLSPWFAAQLGQAAQVRTVAYTMSIVLAAIALLLVVKKVPESRASAQAKPRNVAALCAWVAGVCAVIFGVVMSGSLGWSSPLVLGTLAAGGAILLALVWLRGHPPGENWRFVLRFERRLTVAILAGVILNLGLYAVAVQIFGFLQRVQDYDVLRAGLRLAPILIGPLLLGAVASRLSVRAGMRGALSVGLLLVAVSAAGFGFLQPDISYWVLAPLLALLGLGFIIGNAPYLLLLSSSVPHDLAATVQAVGRTTAQLGGALAYALMLNLIADFGTQAFVRSAEAAGVTPAGIEQQLSSLAAIAGDISLVLGPEVERQVLEWIAPGVDLAYTVGLSRAMWVLAGLCVFGAALVWVGLPGKQTEPGQEPDLEQRLDPPAPSG
jgi:MFS family permease